tara:strand:+ start:227 stop:583 length:357 start_codon:yes stop_codon:yes gene_type:complete
MKTTILAMKTTILATTFALAASGAFAEGLLNIGAAGEVEYSVEGEAFAMEVGPTMTIGNIGVAPKLLTSMDSSLDLSMVGVEVEATYGLSNNLQLFGEVSADKDFDYQDLKMGVRFQF